MSIRGTRKIEVIGAPVGLGGNHEGSALGPAALRIAGFIKRVRALGFDVHDCGDAVPYKVPDFKGNSKIRHHAAIAGWSRTLSDMTYTAMKNGALPIVLGGDHSISIGSVNGVAKYHHENDTELFVLWVDAHADFNTPEITPTGNTHGMPAAHLCGEPGMDDFLGDGSRHTIAPQNLYLFGTRWIDPEEQLLLGRRGVNVIDARTIERKGISALLGMVIDEVKARRGILHVSLDLDFLDPRVAPAVGTPEPCGFSEREAHTVMEMLCDSELVRSIDVVELNPLLDDRNKCAELLTDLITSFLGRRIMDLSENSAKRKALAEARYSP